MDSKKSCLMSEFELCKAASCLSLNMRFGEKSEFEHAALQSGERGFHLQPQIVGLLSGSVLESYGLGSDPYVVSAELYTLGQYIFFACDR